MRLAVPLALMLAAAPALAEPPPMPDYSVAPDQCEWHWRGGSAGGVTLGLWVETCAFETGVWDILWDPEVPGMVQVIDGGDAFPVLQLFVLPPEAAPGAGPEALLPGMRAAGLIPDDGECVFVRTDMDPVTPTAEMWDIYPVGARLAAFEAAPQDEVPEPPCGPYGFTPDGVSYYLTDPAAPRAVLRVEAGQDTPLFDQASIRLAPAE